MDDGLTKPMSQVNYHRFIKQLRVSDHDVNDGGEAHSLIPHRKDEIALAGSEGGVTDYPFESSNPDQRRT